MENTYSMNTMKFNVDFIINLDVFDENVDIIETLSLKWKKKNSKHVFSLLFYLCVVYIINVMRISPLILEEFAQKSLGLRWGICFQLWFELYKSRVRYYKHLILRRRIWRAGDLSNICSSFNLIEKTERCTRSYLQFSFLRDYDKKT